MYILKALLFGAFAPNLLFGSVRIRDPAISAESAAGGGGKETNAKEALLHEMLLRGLDPRRCCVVHLDAQVVQRGE